MSEWYWAFVVFIGFALGGMLGLLVGFLAEEKQTDWWKEKSAEQALSIERLRMELQADAHLSDTKD